MGEAAARAGLPVPSRTRSWPIVRTAVLDRPEVGHGAGFEVEVRVPDRGGQVVHDVGVVGAQQHDRDPEPGRRGADHAGRPRTARSARAAGRPAAAIARSTSVTESDGGPAPSQPSSR